MKWQHAASAGHYELTRYLLDHGAEPTELPELSQVQILANLLCWRSSRANVRGCSFTHSSRFRGTASGCRQMTLCLALECTLKCSWKTGKATYLTVSLR